MGRGILKEVTSTNGNDILSCMQCGNCSGSCPVSIIESYNPRRIMELVKKNDRDALSDSIWYCISCATCSSRCPREVQPFEVIITLKNLSIKEGVATDNEQYILYKTLLDVVEKYGRVFDPEVFIKFALQKDKKILISNALNGIILFKKGKLHIKPTRIRKIKEVRRIFKNIDKVRYK